MDQNRSAPDTENSGVAGDSSALVGQHTPPYQGLNQVRYA